VPRDAATSEREAERGLAAAFLRELEREFPRFRVVYKRQSAVSHAIHWALMLLTAGGQREFLTGYYTVLGDTLYVPDSWDALSDRERVILLRHERVHLRQRRRYGMLGMTFLYLFPFFPLGLAYGRARIEWEAYVETLRATAELEGLPAARALRERIVSRFTGPAYGWMWPFRRHVERWYEEVIAELEADQERPAKRSEP
jgi:hypothetical protein